MKLSGLAILVIALLLAAGAVFLVDAWLDQREADVLDRADEIKAERARLQERLQQLEEQLAAATDKEAPPPIETMTVLAAAKDLDVGAEIAHEDLKLINVPPEVKPSGAFAKPTQVIGDLVIQAISEGEIILPARLTKRGSLPVTAGMRAITLDIGTTPGQMRLIEPGTRVDVILVGLDGPQVVLNRILQDIKVLALGQRVGSLEEATDDTLASSITFEVTPGQATLLARAADGNNVRLLLRNQADTESSYAVSLIRGTDVCNTIAGQDCQKAWRQP